jgi:ribosomal protein S18 acetylase RimI-like enzyme
VRRLISETKKRKIRSVLLAADNVNTEDIVRFYRRFGFGTLFVYMRLGLARSKKLS